jgi:hypothetical protein
MVESWNAGEETNKKTESILTSASLSLDGRGVG